MTIVQVYDFHPPAVGIRSKSESRPSLADMLQLLGTLCTQRCDNIFPTEPAVTQHHPSALCYPVVVCRCTPQKLPFKAVSVQTHNVLYGGAERELCHMTQQQSPAAEYQQNPGAGGGI